MIRNYTQNDEAALLDLWNTAGTAMGFAPLSQDAFRTLLTGHPNFSPEYTFVLEEQGKILGFTKERAEAQFGFLINAFKYGAPPHAGLAFGLDRFVSILAGLDSIRDCIAFPKNNSGRDVMLDAPAALDQKQLDELQLQLAPRNETTDRKDA